MFEARVDRLHLLPVIVDFRVIVGGSQGEWTVGVRIVRLRAALVREEVAGYHPHIAGGSCASFDSWRFAAGNG